MDIMEVIKACASVGKNGAGVTKGPKNEIRRGPRFFFRLGPRELKMPLSNAVANGQRPAGLDLNLDIWHAHTHMHTHMALVRINNAA